MKRLFEIKGRIQNYAWGGRDFIPELLGIEKQNMPYAEYWMGAHVNAPALILNENTEVPLDSFLQDNQENKLGPVVSSTFGRLPYLFKVLDVYDMLSIQVHPSKREAEKGFRRENEKGIPITASNRNYKDDNHKPEIMVALDDFWLLHGFLPKDRLIEVLTENEEFSGLISIFDQEGYRGLYKYVMEMVPDEADEILKTLSERILPLYDECKLEKSSHDYWAARAMAANKTEKNYDRGIFSIYFFNVLGLKRGEAIFQDAGVPHAYLEGQNMELMANSDNVLRGGLTQKHVDVPELLKHVVFEETYPEVLHGILNAAGTEKKYKSPAPDFELSVIKLDSDQQFRGTTSTTDIFFVTEGKADIREGNTSLSLKKGVAFLLIAGSEFKIVAKMDTAIYRATAPC